MKLISKSVEETEKIAKEFIEKISMGFYDGAVVVGLYGDLGSGKTTFTQAVARHFGIDEYVTSPTFVIMKRYRIDSQKSKVKSQKNEREKNSSILLSTLNFPLSTFVHVDAYRLDSGKELLALDWERDLRDSRNLIFIEWPERVAEILPKNHIKINFKFVSENEREIEI
jgi:tRNA threonylcarbamoyladenosine biosynthesis protein TsaE